MSVFLIVKCVLGKLLVVFWCSCCMWLSVWNVVMSGMLSVFFMCSVVLLDMKKFVCIMLIGLGLCCICVIMYCVNGFMYGSNCFLGMLVGGLVGMWIMCMCGLIGMIFGKCGLL